MILDTQRHYNLITAFRGPDSNSAFAVKVKWAFTAKFRHWIDPSLRMCDVRLGPLSEGEHQTILDWARAMEGKPTWFNHFMGHCDMALRSFSLSDEFSPNLDELARLQRLFQDLLAMFRPEE